MLVTLNDILIDAKKNGYAVGLFNTVNLEMAKGVLAAAEELRSPVIIGTAEVLLPYAALEELASFLLPMAKKASVPVVLHFDHGITEKCIKQAINLGFSSVMYDCSNLLYMENANAVKAMTEYAHSKGVSVEAELGHVGGNEIGSGDDGTYTDPFQAKDFYEYTKIDALAVAIGTAHGVYRDTPKLQYSLLKQINELIEAPLVLHGGSGLSDSDFRHSIENGIAKVNIFTDINQAAAKAAYDNYHMGIGITDVMGHIVQAVKNVTMGKMNVFGSVGKA